MSIRVEPQEKKSIVQIDIYENQDRTFKRETTYILGYATIDADLNDIDPQNKIGLKISDYEIEDHDYQDWSSCFWDFDESFSESEQEEIKQTWEDEWEQGLNDLGWALLDQDVFFYGPLNLTEED
jgi:hypothetical protein